MPNVHEFTHPIKGNAVVVGRLRDIDRRVGARFAIRGNVNGVFVVKPVEASQ